MSVDQKILHWLETELFEGRIALGENLPDDRRIADILKTGHSSTREAIKRLEIMGVFRLFEGKRKTIIPQLVSDPARAVTPALRLHMAQAQHPTRDLIQTWVLLETWAVSRADRSNPAMTELERLLEEMKSDALFPQDFHELEASFHVTLVKLAGNHAVSGMMTALHDSIYEYLLSLLGRVPLWSATAARLRAEHQAIVDALKCGDNELAQQLVAASIENQYAEAGIELDEPTEVANSLPGTLARLEPVEDEPDDDLVPETWEGSVSPTLISALENIGSPSAPSQPAPAATSPEAAKPQDDVLPAETAQAEKSQPAETHNIPEQTQEQTGQEAAPWARAQEAKAQRYSDYAADPDYVPFSERNVLRAPEKQGAPVRKRRGTVSAPVHATVIKPIDRSGRATGVAAGQVPSKSQGDLPRAEKPVQAKENSWGEPVSRDVLRAKPREKAEPVEEAPQAEPREEETPRARRFGKWFHRQGGVQEFDTEAHELARQQRLAVLTAPENDVAEADHGEQEQDSLPSGYVLADEYKEPEVIDQTQTHSITKKKKKKKKKR